MAENCKVDDCQQRELRYEIERLRKELQYWERIGRDKLDAELMRGLAADSLPTGREAT